MKQESNSHAQKRRRLEPMALSVTPILSIPVAISAIVRWNPSNYGEGCSNAREMSWYNRTDTTALKVVSGIARVSHDSLITITTAFPRTEIYMELRHDDIL